MSSSRPSAVAGARDGVRRLLGHVTFTVGLVITIALVMTAAVSLVYTPHDPLEMSIVGRLQGPSEAHLLGTDQFGRDLLSRIMAGAVTSILVGVIAVGIGMGIGVILGMCSGYFGGWLDEGFMRLMDAVQGFPAILSALLMAAVFRPSLGISMVAIGVAFLPVFARLTRASFLEFRDREFVLAARALGAGDRVLIVRHVLPNTMPPLIVQATISFPVAILAEAALSYLGLGTQPPHPSWGLMLKESQAFLGTDPWYAVFPGSAIALTVLGLNLLGDGLRDLLDPKLSG
ncbi:MAG TPA: ABC transporter permease [Candidatus Methylomirabilis sp.]|nr:ABC transporter permease [Candidatus Methylomirabilis sp.]